MQGTSLEIVARPITLQCEFEVRYMIAAYFCDRTAPLDRFEILSWDEPRNASGRCQWHVAVEQRHAASAEILLTPSALRTMCRGGGETSRIARRSFARSKSAAISPIWQSETLPSPTSCVDVRRCNSLAPTPHARLSLYQPRAFVVYRVLLGALQLSLLVFVLSLVSMLHGPFGHPEAGAIVRLV